MLRWTAGTRARGERTARADEVVSKPIRTFATPILAARERPELGRATRRGKLSPTPPRVQATSLTKAERLLQAMLRKPPNRSRTHHPSREDRHGGVMGARERGHDHALSTREHRHGRRKHRRDPSTVLSTTSPPASQDALCYTHSQEERQRAAAPADAAFTEFDTTDQFNSTRTNHVDDSARDRDEPKQARPEGDYGGATSAAAASVLSLSSNSVVSTSTVDYLSLRCALMAAPPPLPTTTPRTSTAACSSAVDEAVTALFAEEPPSVSAITPSPFPWEERDVANNVPAQLTEELAWTTRPGVGGGAAGSGSPEQKEEAIMLGFTSSQERSFRDKSVPCVRGRLAQTLPRAGVVGPWSSPPPQAPPGLVVSTQPCGGGAAACRPSPYPAGALVARPCDPYAYGEVPPPPPPPPHRQSYHPGLDTSRHASLALFTDDFPSALDNRERGYGDAQSWCARPTQPILYPPLTAQGRNEFVPNDWAAAPTPRWAPLRLFSTAEAPPLPQAVPRRRAPPFESLRGTGRGGGTRRYQEFQAMCRQRGRGGPPRGHGGL